DHVFVYERESETLGDGRFRMSLGVTGDEFTGLLHFVHVPEAFERRFAAMRAANNAIARVAGLGAGLLYGIGGCVLGALWLLRKRVLIWRQALAAGIIVAGLNALAILANSPQGWFNVDTAQSEWVLWGQQIGVAMLVLLGGGLGLAPIGMALQAGFMEECLFRAVPLSLEALIGARFGHRGVAIGVALVLQAVIFGAAHANYPGFPAYSRLVELIGPSLIWGLIFL